MSHLQFDPDSHGLDPRARSLIELLQKPFDSANISATAARKSYRETRAPYLWQNEDVAATYWLPVSSGVPALKMFRPLADPTRGQSSTFIFLHGGGWTVGDLSTYEPLCRRLSNALNANIIWVDYRKAPEHPYPVPLNDALAACRWVFSEAENLRINPQRIGVMGDSAGANLAAVAALSNRSAELGQKFHCQVLIYPCLDLSCTHDSHRTLGKDFLLTSELYGWYVQNYARNHNLSDWRLSPLHADDISGLAPAIVLHAGFDPLRDEAIAYVKKLRAAKIPVKELNFGDMIHGFINMGAVLPQAEDAILCIRSSLHTLLSPRLAVR